MKESELRRHTYIKKLRGYWMSFAVFVLAAAIVGFLFMHGEDFLGAMRARIWDGIGTASEYVEDAGLGSLRKSYIKQDKKTKRIESEIDTKYNSPE